VTAVVSNGAFQIGTSKSFITIASRNTVQNATVISNGGIYKSVTVFVSDTTVGTNNRVASNTLAGLRPAATPFSNIVGNKFCTQTSAC